MAPIEITIPAEASEVTLKTAGKYCDKDIVVKNTNSFRVETKTFTITATQGEEYAVEITLPDIKPGAKLVICEPNFTPTNLDASVYKYFVHKIYCSDILQSEFPWDNGVYLDAYRQDTNAYERKVSDLVKGENAWTFVVPKTQGNQFHYCQPGEYTYKAYYWDE